jgi:hypothetical protein
MFVIQEIQNATAPVGAKQLARLDVSKPHRWQKRAANLSTPRCANVVDELSTVREWHLLKLPSGEINI